MEFLAIESVESGSRPILERDLVQGAILQKLILQKHDRKPAAAVARTPPPS
jgi:hypothetical protein